MKLACQVTVAIVMSASHALAQVYLPPPPPHLSLPNLIWNSQMMRQLGTNATGQALLGEQLQRDLANRLNVAMPKASGVPNAETSSAAGPAAIDESALSYPFTGTHVLPARIAEGQSAAGARTPMTIDDLHRLVASLWSAYQTSFREEHERLKMPVHDAATAMTYCIVANYMIFNGLDQLDASHSVAVYRQVARLLLDNPEFATFGATDRQALAEVLVAMGGMPALTSQMTRDASRGRKVAESTLVNLLGQQGPSIKIAGNGLEF